MTHAMIFMGVLVFVKRSYSREFPAICGRGLVPRLRKSTQIRLGTRLSWPRIRGARIRVQSMSAIVTPTPLGSYPDDEIRSGSAG